ncbi:MAG: 2-oxoglutarate dehydrogenase E1 subunit family protein [Porticoccaceae bacterium]
MMKALWGTSFLGGGNAAYLEEQYENWLRDPNSVTQNLRDYFEQLPTVNGAAQDVPHSDIREQFEKITRSRAVARDGPAVDVSLSHERKQVGVNQLINAYRIRGHQWAKLNPLAGEGDKQPLVRELELGSHGLTDADLDTVFNTGSLRAPEQMTLKDIRNQLQRTYCGSIGIEYMHMLNTTQKEWLQQRFESAQGKPHYDYATRRWLLERLTAAEGIEKYLHTKYVGQKRFSLEGGESLIPMMSELVRRSGKQGIKELGVGMAHRGRLNVLVNIFGQKTG